MRTEADLHRPLNSWVLTLIHPGARELDHLAPFLGFVGHQLAEVGGGARKQNRADLGEPRLRLRIGQDSLTALLSLSTISAGVPFGAARPYQALAS